MNILFWNLKGNNNQQYIISIIRTYSIDIAVFCEYNGLIRDEVLSAVEGYSFSDGMDGCEKILFLFRDALNPIVRREANRYAMYSFTQNNTNYLIVGLHLPANPTSNVDDRKNIIRDLMPDLRELENENNCWNTIVIGDFNACPFDSELTQKDMFNAVPFKDIINNFETITYQDKRYRRFYNPMVHFISEDTKHYGSVYHTGGSNTITWYCYDQIIVRKPLVDRIREINYLKKIGDFNLVSPNGIPKGSVSDHLPLLVEVDEL